MMMTINAGRPLIDLVKLCYAANLPLMIEGRHGVGKSVLLEQAAEELKIGYICRDLSIMEPPDLVGLPKLDGAVTKYLPPSFLPTRGKGLLVFEELNRCPSYMRAPCLQLLTARKINDYTLPPGWLPCAAINPPEEGYEADDLDPALLSRFDRTTVEPDHDEWLAWARTADIHPGVVAYVETDFTVFDRPESNPRAWTYVSQLAHALCKSGASAESFRVAVVGVVGPERGAAFLRVFSDKVRPLTAEEVLDYPRHRAQLKDWIASCRLDLLKGSLHALLVHLQPKRNYDLIRANSAAWKNLSAFVAELPGDLSDEARKFFKEHRYDVPRARRGA